MIIERIRSNIWHIDASVLHLNKNIAGFSTFCLLFLEGYNFDCEGKCIPTSFPCLQNQATFLCRKSKIGIFLLCYLAYLAILEGIYFWLIMSLSS